MFGLSATEILAILAVALIVFGPKQLPKIGRRLGSILREFRSAADDLKVSLTEDIRDGVKSPVASEDTSAAPKAQTAAFADKGSGQDSGKAEAPQTPQAPDGAAESTSETPPETKNNG